MTNTMKITGILATIVIVIILPVYALLESTHQDELLADHYTNAILTSTELYAQTPLD
jgi:hypothetical protein